MGDDYWLETQASLQGDDPLFSKPKLAENLLKKPPFRFIHDIVTGVSLNSAPESPVRWGRRIRASEGRAPRLSVSLE